MLDTPFKELFNEVEPAFSSGCIRLSEAVGLALLILKDQYHWDQQKVKETLRSGRSTTVNLASPINVYISYFTSWVNDKGLLQFRKDIYTRDTNTTGS
jgi:murein L,D-transpeptidase YcbB/YkuD